MKCFYCFLLLIPFAACSQQQAPVQGIDIRSEVSRLKNFSHEPIYQLRVKTVYTYTILINGIPIMNKQPYLNDYTVLINPCIPAKGEQEIEIRLYPRFTGVDTQAETLENGIDFELEIQKTAWKDGSLEEPEIVYSYRLPEEDHSGQRSFVHRDVFEASTPYRLIDWREGRTFNEQDTAMLKVKALEAYRELISRYESRRGEDYVNAVGRGIFNLCQASYFTEEEALDYIDHSIDFINKSERDLAEITNYKLEILADGKLLSLRRTDGFNREEGVIRRYYKKDRKERVHIYDVLLYAPGSSDGGDLEVIWYTNLVKNANP